MPLPCEQIRNEFSALLDDELNSEDRELIEEHLSDCADCLRELHGYKQVSDTYFYHHPVKAPNDFEDQLRARLAPPKKLYPFPHTGWRIAVAAMVLLASGLSYWQITQGTKERVTLSSTKYDTESLEADAEAPALAPAAEALMEQSMAPALSSDNIEGVTAHEGTEKEIAMAPSADATSAEDSPTMFSDDATTVQTTRAADRAAPADSDAPLSADIAEPSPPVMSAPTPAEDSTETKQPAPSAPMALRKSLPPPSSSEKDGASTPTLPEVIAERENVPMQSVLKSPPTPEHVNDAPAAWRDRRFELRDNTLVQEGYNQENPVMVTVPSGAWATLLDAHPDLRKLYDGTRNVIVNLDDVWYQLSNKP